MADRNPSTGVADGCWYQLLKSSDSCTQVARYHTFSGYFNFHFLL